MAPIVLYSDDTSGNRSKKWNKFGCWCMSVAGRLLCEARKIENIHLLSCSNHVSVLDMAVPITDDLKQLEEGIEIYDSLLKRNIIVIAPVLCFLCDNVRASELLNHPGSKANKFYRILIAVFFPF